MLHQTVSSIKLCRFPLGPPEHNPSPSPRVETVDCGDEAASWLSDFLGQPCRLIRQCPDFTRDMKKRPSGGTYITIRLCCLALICLPWIYLSYCPWAMQGHTSCWYTTWWLWLWHGFTWNLEMSSFPALFFSWQVTLFKSSSSLRRKENGKFRLRFGYIMTYTSDSQTGLLLPHVGGTIFEYFTNFIK